MFHPIEPRVPTSIPGREREETLAQADPARRAERRRQLERELRKRVAKHIPEETLAPLIGRSPLPAGMKTGPSKPPGYFPGGPEIKRDTVPSEHPAKKAISTGDSLAARARKLKKQHDH